MKNITTKFFEKFYNFNVYIFKFFLYRCFITFHFFFVSLKNYTSIFEKSLKNFKIFFQEDDVDE